MVKFIKLSILSIVIWSEFCVLGYFTHSVCHAIIEALFVSKRKIKKVFFSVFGEIQWQNQSQCMMFCTLKPMLSVISNISRRYYLEIISDVRATFEWSSLSPAAERGKSHHSYKNLFSDFHLHQNSSILSSMILSLK